MLVMALTQATIERIKKVWQERLRLSHWDIVIKWDEMPPTDSEAYYNASDHYDHADIRISPTFPGWSRHEANVTVVHELVHVMQRDVDVSVADLQSHIDQAAWEMWDGRYNAAREGLTERTARALVDLAGVV